MYAALSIIRQVSSVSAQGAGLSCPLNHGVATLDQLLASLMGEDDSAAFDAALDLRWQLSNSNDASAIIREFYHLRSVIEERHYLACYRLRRWLENQLVACVSFQRNQPERLVAVHLDAANPEELTARCIAGVVETSAVTSYARVRFAFASSTVSA